MEFTFSTADRIQFGNGVSRSVSNLLPKDAKRILVVTGSTPERYRDIVQPLEKSGLESATLSVSKEPTIDSIADALGHARSFRPDVVLGIGGGSVVDSGKAIAALLQNEGELLDYLEVVGKGKPLLHPSIPYMAIPTTAGTGSEVTRNSVIGVPERGVKVSLRSEHMIPRWAVVDPELTHALPSRITAYTGMDALIQCLEAYLSRKSNPLTDGIALEGIERAALSIRKTCGDKLDPQAKSDLCVASLCGGIALANAGLGAVHGFAGPLGGMIDAPHGALCASLLIPVLRTNFEIASRRQSCGELREKFDRVARVVTGNPSANGNYAIAWFESLVKELPLASLGELGLTEARIPEAVDKAAVSSSMKGNPIELEKADLREILEDCLSES